MIEKNRVGMIVDLHKSIISADNVVNRVRFELAGVNSAYADCISSVLSYWLYL